MSKEGILMWHEVVMILRSAVCFVLFNFAYISYGHVITVHQIIHEHAKCVDGTVPEYHFREGYDMNKNKWIIYFLGGGWSYDLQAILYRTKTVFGSTKYNKNIKNRHWHLQGIIDENKLINPYFYNWNVVIIEYCDGTSFSGDAIHHYNVGR